MLVLWSVMFPVTGDPENGTAVDPVAGEKIAVIGFSVTVIVRCAESVEVPSLTCN